MRTAAGAHAPRDGRAERFDGGAWRRSSEVTQSFDATLSTDGWVGFSFPDEESKARLLAAYALRLGRMLGAKTIVVLELDGADDRRAVVGSVLSVDSTRATRTASMAVAPVEPSAETLATLGDYLSGARPGLPEGAVDVVAEKPRDRTETGGYSLANPVDALTGLLNIAF